MSPALTDKEIDFAAALAFTAGSPRSVPMAMDWPRLAPVTQDAYRVAVLVVDAALAGAGLHATRDPDPAAVQIAAVGLRDDDRAREPWRVAEGMKWGPDTAEDYRHEARAFVAAIAVTRHLTGEASR